MTLNGKIIKISENDPYNTGHNKKYVKIETLDKSTWWVEFKGWKLSLLERFKVSDMVSIEVFGVATESASGTRFSNNIAKNIQELELHPH